MIVAKEMSASAFPIFYVIRGIEKITVQVQWQLRRGPLPPSIGEGGEEAEWSDLADVPCCTQCKIYSLLWFWGDKPGVFSSFCVREYDMTAVMPPE